MYGVRFAGMRTFRHAVTNLLAVGRWYLQAREGYTGLLGAA